MILYPKTKLEKISNDIFIEKLPCGVPQGLVLDPECFRTMKFEMHLNV